MMNLMFSKVSFDRLLQILVLLMNEILKELKLLIHISYMTHQKLMSLLQIKSILIPPDIIAAVKDEKTLPIYKLVQIQ